MSKQQDTLIKLIEQDPGFERNAPAANMIKVIGVGGGGVNAVNRMQAIGTRGVSYAVINTDAASLAASTVGTRLVIGNGRGAGDKPEKARRAAEDARDDIAALLDDGTRLVFVAASMGGGTGTGAAPVVARIAHERGVLTVGIVTIPFRFEGNVKIRKALDGARAMSEYVDALIVIDNQKLLECYPDSTMDRNFELADDTLARAVISISEMVIKTGFWNIDMEDVDTTLREGGVAIISMGRAQGEHRVAAAIEQALSSPLLRNRDINCASRLLISVESSHAQTLTSAEVLEIQEFKKRFTKDLEQITGWYYDDALAGEVKITILVAGFDLRLDDDDAAPSTTSSPYRIITAEQIDDDTTIAALERTPALTHLTTEPPAPTPPSTTIRF